MGFLRLVKRNKTRYARTRADNGSGVRLRIAVVQLRCHQAAVIGNRDYLAEPFVDASMLPMAALTDQIPQLKDLRHEIKSRYLSWHRERVDSCLNYIAHVDNLSMPKTQELRQYARILVVVFPEFSIPFEHLSLIHDWVSKTANQHREVVVFAGTHAVPPLSKKALNLYRKRFKASKNELAEIESAKLPSRSILPIFYTTTKDRKQKIFTKLKLKRILSPFELTNTAAHSFDPDALLKRDLFWMPLSKAHLDARCNSNSCEASAYTVTDAPALSFLPAVCSEALQVPTAGSGNFDVVIIPAYHDRPSYFDAVKEQWIRNQRLVVLANDGLFGGSGLWIPPSTRGEGWWLSTPNEGALPPGDAILMADVSPSDMAEESRVFNPSEKCKLLRLSSVVPHNQQLGEYRVSQSLAGLRRTECRRTKKLNGVNFSTRQQVLLDCLTYGSPNQLQRIKIRRLQNLRTIGTWDFHADDAVIRNKASGSLSQVPSMLQLEKQLARTCRRHLRMVQDANELRASQSALVDKVLKECREFLQRSEAYLPLYPGDPVNRVASNYLGSLSRSNSDDAKRMLAQRVAELAEQFRATSAWLVAFTPSILFPGFNSDYADADNNFMEENHSPLRCIVAHNGSSPSTIEMTQSLAGRCINERRVVVYPRLLQRHAITEQRQFKIVKESTASAMGVPVFVGSTPWSVPDNQIVGAVVMESNQQFSFSVADGHALMNAARCLAADLTYLVRRNQSYAAELLWRPQSVGWSVAYPMQSLTDNVSEALQGSTPDIPRVGVTIWHSQSSEGTASALGAVGFDADYITRDILRTADRCAVTLFSLRAELRKILRKDPSPRIHRSLFALSRTGNKQILRMSEGVRLLITNIIKLPDTKLPPSVAAIIFELRTRQEERLPSPFIQGFVGRMLTSSPGTYVAEHWRRIPEFQRQVKAERLELSQVIATNFGPVCNERLDFPSDPSAHDSAKNYSEQNRGLISFSTHEGAFNSVAPFLSSTRVREFARKIHRTLSENQQLREEYATILLRSRLKRYGISQTDQLSIFRELVTQVLRGDGCSIFLRYTEQSSKGIRDQLRCVSSSGFDVIGYAPDQIGAYDLLEASALKHFTVAAFVHKRTIVMNTEHRPYRDTAVGFRIRERLPASQSQHRRLVVVPLTVDNSNFDTEVLGVVRVARTERHPPFSDFDIRLLETVVAEFCAVFTGTYESGIVDPRKDPSYKQAESKIKSLMSSYQAKGRRLAADDRPHKSCRALLASGIPDREWGAHACESILSDLSSALSGRLPVLAMLRTVACGDPRRLVTTAWHSYASRRVSDAAARGFFEPEGSLGWLTIAANQLVFCGKHHPLFRDSFTDCHDKTEQAMLVPVLLPFRDQPVMSVLSLELASTEEASTEKKSKRDEIAIFLSAAWQLASIVANQVSGPDWLCSSNHGAMTSVPDGDWYGWLRRTFQASHDIEDYVSGKMAKSFNSVSIATDDFIGLLVDYGRSLGGHALGTALKSWQWKFEPNAPRENPPAQLNTAGMRGKSDPFWQAALVANREITPSFPPKAGNVTGFDVTRIPSALRMRAEGMHLLGAELNLASKARSIRLPLWCGSTVAGFLVGVDQTSQHSNAMPDQHGLSGDQRDLLTILEMLGEITWQWSSFVGRGIRSSDSQRGIGVNTLRQDLSTGSEAKLESFRLFPDFDSTWLRHLG